MRAALADLAARSRRLFLRSSGRLSLVLAVLVGVLSLTVLVAQAALRGTTGESPPAAGASANLHLGKTVASAKFVPSLGLGLGVDHSSAIPGDTLTYHATLTNSGATATLTGDLSAGNTNATTATVAAYWDNVATSSNPGQGCPTNHGHDTAQWTPFVGAAASQPGYTPVVPPPIATGMTLSLTPVPASGVSYPSTGDRMLGTTLSPGATATWHYVASIPLSVAQEGFLLDPKQVSKLRNTLHAEVSPRNANAAQPSFVDTCFKPSLFGSSPGTATAAKITIAPPTGAPVTFSAPSIPALASVAPGASVKVSTPYKVPAVAGKGASESDSDYLARLQAVDGSALIANASATAESSGGPLSAKAQPVSTTEKLPVLAITKTGPSSAEAGTTVEYELALKNSGSAQASSLAATDKASDETAGTVSELPASLAPAATATAKAALAVPSSEPAGELTDTASLSWRDANGNGYGPISSSATTTINSTAGISPISTTTVQGNFYAAESSAQTFTAKPGDTPAFGQNFPTIDFNPPAGTIAHLLAGLPTVDPTTRPFTDITTDQVGNGNGVIVAQGNGQQAGVGPLNAFDAALTANFVVAKAGDVTFNIVHDDGFLLGIGGGATRISGAYENAPGSNASSFHGYPLVGAFNEQSGLGPRTDSVTIHFPKAGSYPYELDYFKSAGTELSLTMTVASFAQTTSPLNVYVGYADGLRPAGSVFPFPWAGSPGVTFVGGGRFDSGALRFRNDSNAPIPLERVTVDVGGAHFDIWPSNLTVPPGEDLILAQTNGENFDSSDFSGAGCGGNNGVLPKVNVTIGGKTSVFTDRNQVLNTRGFDLACQGNESTSWQLVGGEGTVVNTPLPPATSLTLSPAGHTTLNVNQQQVFTAAAMDANGKPVANLPVTLALFGPNAQHLTATTAANGVATFAAIIGHNAGEDSAQATAFVQGRLTVSDTSTLTWNIPVPGGPPSGGTPGQAPPSITEIGPTNGTEVTKPVPVTASIKPPEKETITSWKVTAQALDPEPVVVLASGTGTPPSPLATFDPTKLPNGTYEIAVSATASGGGTQTATSTVAVRGNLKLGRYTTTYQDLSVPINGFQMQVRRVYDSIDKRVGDFGVGWHVELANFRVATNRELGAGGWSEYATNCFGSLCLYAFKTSAPHYVTITFPDGHQEVFDFTPEGGSTLFSAASARFTARPGTGTTSTLEAGASLGLTATGDLVDGGGNPYNPTRFTLTTHDGTVLVLDVHSGLVSETDRNGNSLTVDSTGVHSSSGRSISFERDPQGRITNIMGPSGQRLTYGYSTAGDLESSTDADGNTTNYSYNANHNLLKTTGPGGQALQTLTYDSSGRLTSVTDADGNKTIITNDVPGQQQTVVDPNGKLTTVLTYDALGDLLQQDQLVEEKTLTTRYTYDSVGRPTRVVDPLGRATSATYDTQGDPLSTIDAAGHTTTTAYNTFGEPTTVTDPTGAVVVRASYDNAGNLTGVQGPDGQAVQGTYDSQGRLVETTDAHGNKATMHYDSAGNVTTATNSAGATQATFDESGHMTSFTDASGAKTSYTYDPSGLLNAVTDPRGNKRTAKYDALGRLVSQTDPLGAMTTYVYDGTSQLLHATAPDGKTVSYTYDVDGRVTSISGSDGSTVSYAYDPLGRLVDARNAISDIRRGYDAAGQLVSETASPLGGSGLPESNSSYTYTAAGARETRTGPDGTTSYGYDALNRMISITDPAGSKFGVSYDSASRPLQLTRPNGVSDMFTYDALGRLTGRTSKLGEATVASSSSELDAAGRRTNLYEPAGTTSFSHDAVGRLLSVTPPTGPPTAFTYDASGNRLTPGSLNGSTFTYDAANRLLGDAGLAFSYDAQNRVTSRIDHQSNTTTAFTWNDLGQLIAVGNPDGTSTSYEYDALGRRVQVSEAGQTTRYAYDGANISEEYDAKGARTAGYVFAPGLDQPLEMIREGHRSFYIQDSNGNVTALADENGAKIATYRYDAFGRPIQTTGSITNPFTFGGREYDPRSGLYYNRDRYYEPSTGRFISPDPASAQNPYPYAASDPVDNTDPTGALLIEYAPLLPQQIQLGTHLSGFVRCIGKALVDGFVGQAGPDAVAQDLSGAAGQFSGITDITGLVYGSGHEQAKSAANFAANSIDTANESLATLSTQTTTFFSLSTYRVVFSGSRSIVNPITGEQTVRHGYSYPFETSTLSTYTSSTVIENKPYPHLGAFAEFWTDGLSPAIDLKNWFDVVCGNCKK
jgi:RHS repeat-associated protein